MIYKNLAVSIVQMLVIQVIVVNNELLICSGETCSQCLKSNPACGWCAEENFKSTRCAQVSDLINSGCRNELIEFPNNTINIVKNKDLSWSRAADISEVIQIKPQLVKLTLRSNATIEMSYRQAVDYPVDLYYLMDLSSTMLKHKETLAKLGNELANQMRSITKNFRLGFGSFIDKNIQPFTDTNPMKLKSPCNNCASPYAFKHSMSLDTNTTKFINLVKRIPFSGNIDGPEGGLDAIMQAIVCREEIGWRKDARKLLILTTDADYHYAGDGKLAGLIKPNDEQCYLDSQGLYVKGNEQDYPSINQINMVSQENNVHIIFSIAGKVIERYKKLDKKIKSSSLAELSENSGNIVDIIKREYQRLTSNIQLTDNSSDHLRLTYYSSCLSKGVSDDNLNLLQTPICEGLQVDSQVMFKVKIELISCPEKRSDRREIVKINPLGLEEGLIIEVNMICECDCEKINNPNKSKVLCNDKGTYNCGKCNCFRGNFGPNCKCDADDSQAHEKCKRNKNDTIVCSGRGNCNCGECSCRKGKDHEYSGKYCECDDMDCEYANGQPCGGPIRGECKCGRCKCTDLYTGPACDCLKSLHTCIDPTSKLNCNGRGECLCGSCSCKGAYSGLYCDECPTCPGQCQRYQSLVERQILNGTSFENNSIILSLVNELKAESRDKPCLFSGLITNDCAYSFTYRYDESTFYFLSTSSLSSKITENQRVIIKALRHPQCKQPINLKAYAAQYIGSIVVIGLITLLIWRIITFMLDRHEYQKFLKACANIDFPETQNPLFKPSTSTFKNPAYDEST